MEQLVRESEDSQAAGREPACYDFEVARSFLPSSSSTRYEHGGGGGKDRGKKRKEEEWIMVETRQMSVEDTRERRDIRANGARCGDNKTTVALEPEDRLGNSNVRQTGRA